MSIHDFFRDALSAFRQSDVAEQTLRAAPAAGGATYAALTLNEWVAVVTLIYIAFQAVYLARKWIREEKDFKGRKKTKRLP
jgi:membrane protein implicated in regulation of membrane protease activity